MKPKTFHRPSLIRSSMGGGQPRIRLVGELCKSRTGNSNFEERKKNASRLERTILRISKDSVQIFIAILRLSKYRYYESRIKRSLHSEQWSKILNYSFGAWSDFCRRLQTELHIMTVEGIGNAPPQPQYDSSIAT